MLPKLLLVLGFVCLSGVQSRSYLPRDRDSYARYDANDAYIDQLRDKGWGDDDDSEYYDDDKDYYSDEDYSGDYYSDEDDDDEDRDYREWLKEKEAYNRKVENNGRGGRDPFAGMEDNWDSYNKVDSGYQEYKKDPSPKRDFYGRPMYETKSAYKTDEEVLRLRAKLSDMQNEIDNMKGMLGRRERYPYRK